MVITFRRAPRDNRPGALELGDLTVLRGNIPAPVLRLQRCRVTRPTSLKDKTLRCAIVASKNRVPQAVVMRRSASAHGCYSSKDVNPGASLAFFCFHRRYHTPVASPFKLVKASPMLGEVHRLEEVYLY
jgi:hypothetical protein